MKSRFGSRALLTTSHRAQDNFLHTHCWRHALIHNKDSRRTETKMLPKAPKQKQQEHGNLDGTPLC